MKIDPRFLITRIIDMKRDDVLVRACNFIVEKMFRYYDIK